MPRTKTILLTGATGAVGRPLALRLAAAPGLRLRALVRDPARAADLVEAGVQLVQGDFDDEASLATALTAVDTLVLITSANARADEQALAALQAAQAARVRKIVRLSAVKASVDGPTDNTRQHGRVEHAIRAAGVSFVFLRPMAYLTNLLWSAGEILGAGTFHHATADARMSLIDTRDVTDSLAGAATSDAFDGKVFELTGPAAITSDEVVAALAGVLGRPVRAVDVSPDELGEAARHHGADDWSARLVRDYAAAYRSGFGDFTSGAVAELTGHPPRSVDDFAREVFAKAARPG
jgi:uncharacterized protein YbjT (DUF2867 family)